jgi:plasmid stabilization system protein ParE
MKHRVDLTAAALGDIDQAYRWYFERSPEAAEKWRRRLLDAISKLETNPRRCAVAAESTLVNVEIRELNFGRRAGGYRILFTIQDDIVYIVHLRHSARDRIEPDDLLGRIPPNR